MNTITFTLPAKYKCNDCGDLFYETETDYRRRGRWYYISEVCPNCKSKDIESVNAFTGLTTPQKGKVK